MKNKILMYEKWNTNMFLHFSFKITIYEQLSFVSISAGFFYLQHSYFVKNAMLINSAVSFGLGIRNEEFIICFLRPRLIDIWSTSASPMHSYLFSLEKRFISRCFFEIEKGFQCHAYRALIFINRLSPPNVHNDTEMEL